MQIPSKAWDKYIARLRKMSDKAARLMLERVSGLDLSALSANERAEIIDYAYALATKYGEGTGALAAEMYDALAEIAAAPVPAAVPAQTATYAEVAKAVNGTLKTGNAEIVSASVGRMVKMAGVDTTIQNALRDGAEWAWIPVGDTCAFCITLASRGWQRASKKAIKGGHAEHIHANCDCTYAIRFDSGTTVEGYTPDRYLRMYDGADGSTPNERINAMRRDAYAKNRELINEQKRSAYAKRKERESSEAEEIKT